MLPEPPSRRSIAFDLFISIGVVGLTTLGVFMRQTPRTLMWAGFVMAAALLLRRRHPMWTMAAISLAALSQVVFFSASTDPLPYDLAVLIGMFSVVKYARRLAGGYVAAVVVGIGIVIEVVRHGNEQTWWLLALWYLGVCGGVWLMAYTMRQRRLYVASLEERAATLEREREHLARIAVADERAAIARELHDVIAHSLAVMIVQADGARYALDGDPDQARTALTTVAATGRGALDDMRRLVGVLRGSRPAEAEADRRRITLAELTTLVDGARSAGLSVDLDAELARPLPPAIELAVYRIAQEGLTNVLRHAGPGACVALSLRHSADSVTVSVTDDGGTAEIPAPRLAEGTGHGLIGMRERVAVHGGTLDAGPRTGRGWAVRAHIPVLPSEVAA
ncbi:sensor histidine kinase [Hamadaea tsunoensis]|uniref:sensor histidine kinase n=1 Tax=Hamadaea tsunoensis TaxID=53368 RepID=UPI0003F97220|nr:sensor histidine kinase [Hamadaea tsunoensis]